MRPRTFSARLGRLVWAVVSCAWSACAPLAPPSSPQALSELVQGDHGESVGRWALSEMIAPGGQPEQAQRLVEALRTRPDALGVEAQLAVALDDVWHGPLAQAPEAFLRAALSARTEEGPRARLLAWFAAERALTTRALAPPLGAGVLSELERAIHSPGAIGWRARSRLVDRWLEEQPAEDVNELSVREHGCVSAVRLAGPFGGPAAVHRLRSFAAERPGPWPQQWPLDPMTGAYPHVLSTRAKGCEISSEEPVPSGVFYAETYLELPKPEEVLLVARGALSMWVDDAQMLDRDVRDWGQWPRFGVSLQLPAGRHRVVVRLATPQTSVRVLHRDGRPFPVSADTDSARLYRRSGVRLLEDPNDLMRLVHGSPAVASRDPVLLLVGAALAHIEGQDDLAAVLMEPLTRDTAAATGPALETLAEVTAGDPLLSRQQADQLGRDLHRAAVARDASLWRSQMALALAQSTQVGLPQVAAELRQLAERFPDAAPIGLSLAGVYGQLGWDPEYRGLIRGLMERFPNSGGVLHAAVSVLEGDGQHAAADDLLARLRLADPASELLLDRAIERREFGAAFNELDRLQSRDPAEFRHFERRRLELKRSLGDAGADDALLALGLLDRPRSGRVRLAIADAELARGNPNALMEGLARATQAGAGTTSLERAWDRLHLHTAFEPYRLDARQVIAQYEKAGVHQPASAARVLDYAVLWVTADGKSRMLEHEIVRLQSEEAIRAFAEQSPLTGLVLNQRVLKRDGRILEPEIVQGKPTVTMPHLEVGDYVETEHIDGFRGIARGQYYAGPRWFFREENVAYARSEFVVVTPEGQSLEIETTGTVPEPILSRDGITVTRRYRVDQSPAVPDEPMSAPAVEFLPSVRVGWGDFHQRRLHAIAERVAETLPLDPRIVQLAREVVGDAADPETQAKRAYAWVQKELEDGEESDARRALHDRQGNRWLALQMLLRALGLPARHAVVQSRLSPPANGPLSRAESYSIPLMGVDLAGRTVWFTLSEPFAPFGYVPAPARGMAGFVLSVESPVEMRAPEAGPEDLLGYAIDATLSQEGDLRGVLRQRYSGKYAARLRAGLDQVSERELPLLIEQRLLNSTWPGAHLLHHEIRNADDLEAPLDIVMEVEVEGFAQKRAGGLLFVLPLVPKLERLATLEERQTPLLLAETLHQSLELRLRLPVGASVRGLQQGEQSMGEFRVLAHDRAEADAMVVERDVFLPAGRVAPQEYPAFREYVQRAGGALARPVLIDLGAAREVATGDVSPGEARP